MTFQLLLVMVIGLWVHAPVIMTETFPSLDACAFAANKIVAEAPPSKRRINITIGCIEGIGV